MPIPNKPGEPDFKLKVEPSDKLSIVFKKGESVTVDLKIINTTNERNSFKIKCTDNDVFCVRPPLGFVQAKETAVIKITLNSKDVPEPNKHYFAIYHVAAPDMSICEKKVWDAKKMDGVLRLPVQIEELESPSPSENQKSEGAEKENKEQEVKVEQKEEPK